MTQRTRTGCWTCRSRRKKCDEARPSCKRCTKAGIPCGGYDVRLTWSAASASIGSSELHSAPERITRKHRASLRANNKTAVSQHSPSALDTDAESLPSNISIPKAEIRMPVSQSPESSGVSSPSSRITNSDTEAQLFQEFCDHGHLSLTGRDLSQTTLFKQEIIPLCRTNQVLRDVCVAYQANLGETYRRLTPYYVQRSLDGYKRHLQSRDGLMDDAVLVIGILLCSVSIASLYVWTSLLPGLHWVLQQRAILQPANRTKLTNHLIEVIGLLDMPCWTINRLSTHISVWAHHVAPHQLRPEGIEQTSGIPYSLLNILNDLESVLAPQKLLEWSSDVADDFTQVHWWEAIRLAGVLHSRSLRHGLSENEQQTATISNQSVLLKLFASLDAIDSRKAGHTLAHARLYPLFIGGLNTQPDSLERKTCELMFETLITGPKNKRVTLAYEILRETWRRRMLQQHAIPLSLATTIASERGVELYLY